MGMEWVQKAMDSVVAANFERKDLSDLITLQDGPVRPLLQAQNYFPGRDPIPALGDVPAKGLTHYWNEQGLIAPTGSTAGYAEGGKPIADFKAPVQVNNTVARFGKVAAVTDTERAVWTGAGSYQLADGELERLYNEALDYDTALKTEEILNEIEWCLIQGNAANNTNAAVPNSPSPQSSTPITSQFNGILEMLGAATFDGYNAATNYGNGVLVNAAGGSYGAGTTLIEQMIRDLAQQVAHQKTKYMPDLLLVTDPQLEVINTFHPALMNANGNVENLVAGSSTAYYQTGFSRVCVAWEPQLPSGYLLLLCTQLIKKANLIMLGAEPLARVQTQIERMITCEMSMELRVQKAAGVIYDLPY